MSTTRKGAPLKTLPEALAAHEAGRPLTRTARKLLRDAGVQFERKRGRRWSEDSAPNDGDAALFDAAERLGGYFANAGEVETAKAYGLNVSDNLLARAALWIATHGELATQAILAAETELLCRDFASAVVIESAAEAQPQADHTPIQHEPPPGDEDDGQVYEWLSPAFQTETGIACLKAAWEGLSGQEFTLPKNAYGGKDESAVVGPAVDRIARYVRRNRKKKAEQMNRAAQAYCDAILAYEAEHGLVRVSEDGDRAWRYPNISAEQQQEMQELAQAAAKRAAGELQRDRKSV